MFGRLTEQQKELYHIQPDHFQGSTKKSERMRERPNFLQNVSVRCWYNTESAGYGPHRHNALELVLPLEGDTLVMAGSDEYKLYPGRFLLIPDGMLHSYPDQQEGVRIILVADMRFFASMPGYSYVMSILEKPLLIDCTENEKLYDFGYTQIMKLAQDYWGQNPMWELKIYSALIAFFAALGENVGQTASKAISDKDGALASIPKSVLEYIGQNYQREITLEQLAAMNGYSKSYFSRLFKRSIGKSFSDYLKSVRLEEAEKLLLDVRIPVTEVALRSGFSSIASFNRNFRQFRDCTPSEYRQRYASHSH